METTIDISKLKLPEDQDAVHVFSIGDVKIASITEHSGWGIEYEYNKDRSLSAVKISNSRHWISLNVYGDSKDDHEPRKYNSFDEARSTLYSRLPPEVRNSVTVKTKYY